MEDKNKRLTYYKESTNEVSCREKIESNNQAPTINGNGRKGCKTSKVSALEQVRTSPIVSNNEGCTSSDGLNSYDGMMNFQTKGSDLDGSGDKIKSRKGSGSRVESDDETDFNKNKCSSINSSSIVGDEESVHQLRFRRKRKTNIAGEKPVNGKQMREVTKQQRVPASGRIVVVVVVLTLKTVLTSIQYPSLSYSSRQRNEFSWSQANPK